MVNKGIISLLLICSSTTCDNDSQTTDLLKVLACGRIIPIHTWFSKIQVALSGLCRTDNSKKVPQLDENHS